MNRPRLTKRSRTIKAPGFLSFGGGKALIYSVNGEKPDYAVVDLDTGAIGATLAHGPAGQDYLRVLGPSGQILNVWGGGGFQAALSKPSH
jgi:hypothetical protein